MAFFIFDLQQYLTLDALKNRQETIEAYRLANPVKTAAIYALIYIVVAALSLPGATLLTLAGGAFFGLLAGTVIVSFASTLGATLAFLAARFLFRDSVNEKFGHRLQGINDNLNRDGPYYLFTLRLVPLFPFFAVNLVMALTPIKIATFYWVSQIGMLLGTFVYVNAGTQLAKIDSFSGIMSPILVGAFVLLGLFPFFARMIASMINTVKDQRS